MIKAKNCVIARVIALSLILILFLMPVCGINSYAVTSDRTIKVGCFPLNGFYNIQEDGTVSGYGAEYTDAILSHTGWDYEYVIYPSWVEALDALSKNEIDILAPAQHTPERDEVYTFDSFPIGTEYGSLLALSTNDKLIFEDFDSFKGLNVGCVSSLVFLDDFKDYQVRNKFSVNFTYYKDTAALVAALNAGEVDAILANMMVKTESMKLLARFGANPFYYMFSPKADDLREVINQTIDKVIANHPELQNELSEKYFSDFGTIPFSKEELNFINNGAPLTVACAAGYAPFSYVDKKTGKVDGVDHAILEKITEISGLKFSYKAIDPDMDIAAFMKENNISIVAGVENDENTRLHDSNFSEPYLEVTKYFVGNKDKDFDRLVNNNIAVVSSEEAQISDWKEMYPAFTFTRYESLNECIAAVHNGTADFLLEDRYSMENTLEIPKNQDLSSVSVEGISGSICFKTTDLAADSELIISILNKSIKQISAQDKEMYISDYVIANKYKYTLLDYIYLHRIQFGFAFLLFMIAIFTLIFIYKARKKIRKAVVENETRLRKITNNIKGGVIVLKANEGLNITYANDGFLELIGCKRDEFEKDLNGSYLAYVHKDDLHKVQKAIDSDQIEMSLELRVMKKDGTFVPALFNCTAGEKSSGEKELYCVIMDMSEQNRLLEELRVDKKRTELILGAVEEVFYEVNLKTKEITVSPSFQSKLGWTFPEKLENGDAAELESMWPASNEDIGKLRADTGLMLDKKEAVVTTIKLKYKGNENGLWCEIIQHPIISENGAVLAVIGLIRNVDEMITERERLIKKSQLDLLTGLYNKEAFESMVKDTLIELPEQNHALIFIDLDHFKDVNDTLGHMVGDKAICDTADKLKVIFSNYDILSRFGGDEYCIFVKNIPIETLRGKMEWLVEKLHAEYKGVKGSVNITSSSGVAFTEILGCDYDKLMKKADEALYYSKETGRDRFTFSQEITK